jgi:hypothetical protein
MKNERPEERTCANAGCRNKVSAEGRYCDACELEWLLYRRDLRTAATREDLPTP